MLWLCVYLPQFSLQVHTRACENKTRPVAISEGRLVWDCNGPTMHAGVGSGMRLSAAQALCGALSIIPRNSKAEAATLERLAGWAGQFSSVISLAPPDSLLLEIGGSVKLFGGLNKLCSDVRKGLDALGFNVCFAATPTPLSARLFARSGRETYITDLGSLRSALAPIPLKFLPVLPDILTSLHDLGLTSLGDCLRLPRAGLLRRFGREFVDYLDRALGRAPDPLRRYTPPAHFESRLPFPEEVSHTEALLFAVSRLVSELAGFLRATDTGVQRLDIALLAPRLPPQRLTLGLVAPNRDAPHLFALLRERVQRLELQSPVHEMVLRADMLIPWEANTEKLFKQAGQPRKNPVVLIEQLQARLGVDAVHGITEVLDHRPHRAWQRCLPISARRSDRHLNRPLWLLPEPVPIEDPHPPRLQKTQGPERIEGGWWDGEDITRDYFVAVSARGTQLWIFKERQGETRWFLQGMFA
jgi:protein ImuB